jgi:hypothetical protein
MLAAAAVDLEWSISEFRGAGRCAATGAQALDRPKVLSRLTMPCCGRGSLSRSGPLPLALAHETLPRLTAATK